MTLWLHGATHHTEWSPQCTVGAREHAWNDRVIRTLSRSVRVRVPRVQHEAACAVLDRKSQPRRNDAGAKAPKRRARDGTLVACGIHRAVIHGAGNPDGRPTRDFGRRT